jgi:hypothetical protein
MPFLLETGITPLWAVLAWRVFIAVPNNSIISPVGPTFPR